MTLAGKTRGHIATRLGKWDTWKCENVSEGYGGWVRLVAGWWQDRKRAPTLIIHLFLCRYRPFSSDLVFPIYVGHPHPIAIFHSNQFTSYIYLYITLSSCIIIFLYPIGLFLFRSLFHSKCAHYKPLRDNLCFIQYSQAQYCLKPHQCINDLEMVEQRISVYSNRSSHDVCCLPVSSPLLYIGVGIVSEGKMQTIWLDCFGGGWMIEEWRFKQIYIYKGVVTVVRMTMIGDGTVVDKEEPKKSCLFIIYNGWIQEVGNVSSDDGEGVMMMTN